MYCDAHIHIDELSKFYQSEQNVIHSGLIFCASSNTESGFYFTEKFFKKNNINNAFMSFGIHPQNPDTKYLTFLENLCVEKRIDAIGEIGFDLFSEDFRRTLPQQKDVWIEQMLLAIKYELPIVIHSRKAMPMFFEDIALLKKVPAVIFHGWVGSKLEANSFLKKGVNAFFSIGKSLLRGQKSVIEMVKEFDLTRLLTETDAPFMKLKNEAFTKSSDIKNIVSTFANYRKITEAKLSQQLLTNFNKAFKEARIKSYSN